MSYRLKLIYSIVKCLRISHKEAKALIESRRIKVNDTIAEDNILINEFDSIYLDGKSIRPEKKPIYIAYYKPRGVESTMHNEITNNLRRDIELEEDFFPLGRLDKESEGLMLLTNDGKIYNKLMDKKNGVSKTYLVEVDKAITNELISSLENGVEIMGKTTLPCKATATGQHEFKITLIEGLNRQIRRMCYKNGYNVTRLIRIQFADFKLPDDLKSGEWKYIEKQEISIEI